MSETPAPARRGWLGRALRRLTEDEADLDAQDLLGDVAETGAKPVATCEQGQPVTVTGRLRSVVYTPRDTVPTVDAELYDGSGSVHLGGSAAAGSRHRARPGAGRPRPDRGTTGSR